MNLLYVFIGGGIGSLLRYAFSTNTLPFLPLLRARASLAPTFSRHFLPSEFPWATFAANILACVIIGFVSHLYVRGDLNTSGRLLLATGFCGGLSTFSTFSLETLQLIQKGNFGLATIYVLISVLMCLLAVTIPVFIESK